MKTVVRTHHWTPKYVDSLYLDDADCFGLEYWYIDIAESLKEMNNDDN